MVTKEHMNTTEKAGRIIEDVKIILKVSPNT